MPAAARRAGQPTRLETRLADVRAETVGAKLARRDRQLALDGRVHAALAVEHHRPQLATRVFRMTLGREDGVADPERLGARWIVGADEEALVVPRALPWRVARVVRVTSRRLDVARHPGP